MPPRKRAKNPDTSNPEEVSEAYEEEFVEGEEVNGRKKQKIDNGDEEEAEYVEDDDVNGEQDSHEQEEEDYQEEEAPNDEEEAPNGEEEASNDEEEAPNDEEEAPNDDVEAGDLEETEDMDTSQKEPCEDAIKTTRWAVKDEETADKKKAVKDVTDIKLLILGNTGLGLENLKDIPNITVQVAGGERIYDMINMIKEDETNMLKGYDVILAQPSFHGLNRSHKGWPKNEGWQIQTEKHLSRLLKAMSFKNPVAELFVGSCLPVTGDNTTDKNPALMVKTSDWVEECIYRYEANALPVHIHFMTWGGAMEESYFDYDSEAGYHLNTEGLDKLQEVYTTFYEQRKTALINYRKQLEIRKHQTVPRRFKIFVGNLEEEGASEENLRAEFEKYGKVLECDIVPKTGYGFVHMDNEKEALAAIKAMHHATFEGKRINVDMSKSGPKGGGDNRGGYGEEDEYAPKQNVKIFIGNLEDEASEKDLRVEFEKYGKVVECDILSNFGFVHMETMTEAQAAIKALNHSTFGGGQITVKMAKEKGEGGRGGGRGRGRGGFGGYEDDHFDFGAQRARGRGRGFARGAAARYDPYRRDPLERAPPPPAAPRSEAYRDPYYERDPYARYAPERDPYSRYPPPPEREDPYRRREPRDPYDLPPREPRDPYARSPRAPRDPYARPAHDPYDAPRDPYYRR